MFGKENITSFLQPKPACRSFQRFEWMNGCGKLLRSTFSSPNAHACVASEGSEETLFLHDLPRGRVLEVNRGFMWLSQLSGVGGLKTF